MYSDLCNKARNRRILTLARLTRQRLRHGTSAAATLRDIAGTEVCTPYETNTQRLAQSPIMA